MAAAARIRRVLVTCALLSPVYSTVPCPAADDGGQPAETQPTSQARTGTWGDQGDGTYRNPILNADYPDVDVDALYVRTTNDGDQARFAWSADGREFRDFGPTFTIAFGKWTGDRLGLFCWNDLRAQGHVDVDWFRYDYDGPKAARRPAAGDSPADP